MRFRLTDREDQGRWVIVWHVLAILLMLLGPTMARIGLPFWLVPDGSLPQVTVLTAGYLATALFLALTVRAFHGLHVWGAVAIGAAAFGVPFLLLLEPLSANLGETRNE